MPWEPEPPTWGFRNYWCKVHTADPIRLPFAARRLDSCLSILCHIQLNLKPCGLCLLTISSILPFSVCSDAPEFRPSRWLKQSLLCPHLWGRPLSMQVLFCPVPSHRGSLVLSSLPILLSTEVTLSVTVTVFIVLSLLIPLAWCLVTFLSSTPNSSHIGKLVPKNVLYSCFWTRSTHCSSGLKGFLLLPFRCHSLRSIYWASAVHQALCLEGPHSRKPTVIF